MSICQTQLKQNKYWDGNAVYRFPPSNKPVGRVHYQKADVCLAMFFLTEVAVCFCVISGGCVCVCAAMFFLWEEEGGCSSRDVCSQTSGRHSSDAAANQTNTPTLTAASSHYAAFFKKAVSPSSKLTWKVHSAWMIQGNELELTIIHAGTWNENLWMSRFFDFDI